jgi:hypothetical protein
VVFGDEIHRRLSGLRGVAEEKGIDIGDEPVALPHGDTDRPDPWSWEISERWCGLRGRRPATVSVEERPAPKGVRTMRIEYAHAPLKELVGSGDRIMLATRDVPLSRSGCA